MRLITDLDALEWAHKLAAQEGILIGISDGAFSAIAIEAAEQKEPMSKVRCMLFDIGERYLSTPLYDGITEEMAEGQAICKSTPGFQMR